MPVDRAHCNQVFYKLSRQLAKTASQPSPANIHKFRTSCRRVETIAKRLAAPADRQTRKLLKELAHLRRKAGRVRDLDAQCEALRGLKISRSDQKSELLQSLASERQKRERKLLRNLSQREVRTLKSGLKRALRKMEIAEGMEPLGAALAEFGRLERDRTPLSAVRLHRYRIAGKQARYLAESAQKNPEAERVIAQLEGMQDIIGDWHDWLALTERAEKQFGGVRQSALVAAMRNLTRAKFRQALAAVTETQSMLAGETLGIVRAPRDAVKKRSGGASLAVSAAA